MCERKFNNKWILILNLNHPAMKAMINLLSMKRKELHHKLILLCSATSLKFGMRKSISILLYEKGTNKAF